MNMWDVSKPSQLRQLLTEQGFSFKKQLGQNFLIDDRILDKIVEAAGLTEEDGAFEIGPGAGVVTRRLAERAKRVVAVEKDQALRPILDNSLAGCDNVDILFADVLDLAMPELWQRFSDCRSVSMVANLPYYITTPILFHVLESDVPVHNIVVMVQKEVADRLAASPGTKDYGALTVAVQYRAEIERITKVSPSSFMPSPNVESTVIRLRCHARPPVETFDERLFFQVVRASFALRRKTLLNSLSARLGIGKQACLSVLSETGIDPSRRGETLTIEEFARIANRLHKDRNPS